MAEKVNIKIKGHEKFVLREGWLTKGLMAIEDKHNRVFSSKDEGPDILGVGSNMVKAIRYYLQAFDLIEENTQTGCFLNKYGKAIVEYDKYIEDYFTLCLLHSKIASNEEKATSWFLFFNQSGINEFTKDEIQEYLKKELFGKYGKEVPDSSIKDDVDVLLNMYSKVDSNLNPEEKMTCPFSKLGIIKKNGDVYIRREPDVNKISIDIVLYELSLLVKGETSISIELLGHRLETVYNIPWVRANEMLDVLDREDVIKVDRTAGLDVIYPIAVPDPYDVVINHYKG